MNTRKVKDPPHFGFSCVDIELGDKQVSKLLLVLKRLEDTINIRTSTPNFRVKLESVMDVSFSKHYQNHIPQVDNDSGYISQNQESNSESLVEGFTGQITLSDVKSVYLSEDALLEKPEVSSQPIHLLQDTIQSNEEIDKSVNTVSEHFSALHDSSESVISEESEASIIISKIEPITIAESDLNPEGSCVITNKSNVEYTNVANILNISESSNCNYSLENLDSDKENIKDDTCDILLKDIISSPLSPDLFSDEETISDNKYTKTCNKSITRSEKYVRKQDRQLIKNVQAALSGVLPPPSFTVANFSAEEIVERYERNINLFWSENVTSSPTDLQKLNSTNSSELNKSANCKGSLLLTTKDLECTQKPWPEDMEERYHGLHYNRSRISEEFEMLCMKYAERYIGYETHSTCTVFQQTLLPSPLKRKANRLRWIVKSPGKRLSHLARRRITFSSANLQASGSACGLNAHTRQIAVDSKRFQLLSRRRSPLKKSPRKSPKKTPRKSPRKKIRTPSSSAKKRLSLQLLTISQQNTLITSSSRASATKRALFQSPEKSITSSLSKPLFPSTSGTSSISPFKKRMTPKCALFTSPSKSFNCKTDNKRKRSDSDDLHPSKLFRSISLQEPVTSNGNVSEREILKVRSETNLSTSQRFGELSAHHKKKLQWAVYEALRAQNVGINHPQFKQFASVLARVTRRFLPNLAANVPRPEGGTSERMLRIARQHTHAVLKGKTVDEIIHEFEISRIRNVKPSGYIGPETTTNDISTARSKETVFRDRLNTLAIEKQKNGINRDELIKTTLPKFENRIDRARRVIKFDEESKSDIR